MVESITYFLEVRLVKSDSMFPALKSGDRVLILHHLHKYFLSKGKIVLISFEEPQKNGFSERTLYIKRIVGMPGEQIEIATANYKYIANDDILPQAIPSIQNQNGKDIWHVPEGHVFVMGDYSGSLDSRYWGPVPVDIILGVMIAKIS